MYSVIIPTYNRCEPLIEAIESVLLQNYLHIEIIVVDDGSTDDTAEMLAEKYPEVRYFYQANKGPAAARNRGILECQGEFIALLDSDDIWLAHKITQEIKLFRQFPDADVLAGNGSSYLNGQLRHGDISARHNIQFQQQEPRFFDWSLSIMKLGPVCITSAMTFKRHVLQALSPIVFDETLRFDEDWDLEFRLFNQFQVLLYPQLVCRCRICDDETRQFYSVPGKQKSTKEQQHMWQQQKNIIARYIENSSWDTNTVEGFQQRQEQLSKLLRQSFHNKLILSKGKTMDLDVAVDRQGIIVKAQGFGWWHLARTDLHNQQQAEGPF